MKITILTLFPEMFSGPFQESILKHAQEKKLIEINLVNIRDFGIGKHKTVDDTIYGGGTGMLMRVDVLNAAIDAQRDKNLSKHEEKVFLLSATGKTFDEPTARNLSKLKHLILICGHYEGVDSRIENYIDGEISIGDFVVTGGEIPAMLVTDAVARLIPGVLKSGVTDYESFSLKLNEKNHLEYPQFTKPEEYKGHIVPEVLLSGHHGRINKWREEMSMKRTEKNRPDLLR